MRLFVFSISTFLFFPQSLRRASLRPRIRCRRRSEVPAPGGLFLYSKVLINRARYSAVASPSVVGLVAMITSAISSFFKRVKQFFDFQRIVFVCRSVDRSAQDVIESAHLSGFFNGDHIQRIFNDANDGFDRVSCPGKSRIIHFRKY